MRCLCGGLCEVLVCGGLCEVLVCGCLCGGVFSTVGSLACCQCPVSCICSTMKRSVMTSTLSSKGGDTTLFPVLHTCRLVCVRGAPVVCEEGAAVMCEEGSTCDV